MLQLTADERDRRLREMERNCNASLSQASSLGEFQEILYRLIENELDYGLGYDIGRWEYACEVEYWGGASYMDHTLPDELLLKSTYPDGIELSWGEFTFPSDDG